MVVVVVEVEVGAAGAAGVLFWLCSKLHAAALRRDRAPPALRGLLSLERLPDTGQAKDALGALFVKAQTPWPLVVPLCLPPPNRGVCYEPCSLQRRFPRTTRERLLAAGFAEGACASSCSEGLDDRSRRSN